ALVTVLLGSEVEEDSVSLRRLSTGRTPDSPPRCRKVTNNRREPSGGRVGRRQANPGGRPTHHNQRRQKGMFAADQVADPTEEERAEGPDDEADREGRQVGQVSEGGISRRAERQDHGGGER